MAQPLPAELAPLVEGRAASQARAGSDTAAHSSCAADSRQSSSIAVARCGSTTLQLSSRSAAAVGRKGPDRETLQHMPITHALVALLADRHMLHLMHMTACGH